MAVLPKKFSVVVRILAITCIILVIYSSLSFWETYSEDLVDKPHPSIKVAVIYAAPTFHEEVVSSTSCLLHELGYYVVLYVGSGVHIGGMAVPFSGKRKRESTAFYGRCVSRFITIRAPLRMPFTPSVMVFVTYPMVTHGNVPDPRAAELMAYVKSRKLSSLPVIMMAHHSSVFLQDVDSVEKYIPLNQTTYMFMGEHTQNDAKQCVKDKTKNKQDKVYKISHFYPVLPMKYIAGESGAAKMTAYRPQRRGDTVFAVQGHFGGVHNKRKDPSAVIDCLRQIESGSVHVPHSSGNRFITEATMAVGGRGNNSSVASLRDRNLRGRGGGTGSANNGTVRVTGEDRLLSAADRHRELPLNLDLIGRQVGPLQLGRLQHGKVRVLHNLNAQSYYASMAASRFMIVAAKDSSYFTSSATSSVPAALIAEIPVVGTRRFLDIYPCLRDAPVHRHINRDTECESIAAAAELSEEQYQQAKAEVKRCAEVLWEEAKGTFSRIIREG